MKNNTMPTEGENSEKTLGLAGLPDTACSESSGLVVYDSPEEEWYGEFQHLMEGMAKRLEKKAGEARTIAAAMPKGLPRLAYSGVLNQLNGIRG